MYFKKNELINEVLDKNFETWSHTLDTADFVPKKYLNKIDKEIFKNLQNKLKEVKIYNLIFLQSKGFKLGLIQKLQIYFSGLRPLYKKEIVEMNYQKEIDKLKSELEEIKKKKKKRNELVNEKTESELSANG